MTETIRLMLKQLKDKQYRNLRTTSHDEPIIYPVEYFGFHFGGTERFTHCDGNVIPNYSRVITDGFDLTRARIVERMARESDAEKIAFGQTCLDEIMQAPL